MPVVSGPGPLTPGGGDREIALSGPRIPVVLEVPAAYAKICGDYGASVPFPVKGEALIDTGATFTVIHDESAKWLLRRPTGFTKTFNHGGGTTPDADNYIVQVTLAGHDCGLLQMTSIPLKHLGLVAIIGTDFLRQGLFVYDGRNGTFSLAWA